MREQGDSLRKILQDGAAIPGDVVRLWLEATLDVLPVDAIEAALICAVPAWFDLRLLVLLTGKSPAVGEETLAELLALDLITPGEGGGYVYPAALRARLLDVWRAPNRRLRFQAIIKRLSEHYLGLAYEQVLRLRGAERDAALSMLDKFYPNLQAIWDGARTLGNCDLVYALVFTLDGYHTARGLWAQKAAWLESGVQACAYVADEAERAEMLNSLGVAYTQLSVEGAAEYGVKAVACYEEALTFYKSENIPLDYAMVQNNMGNVYLSGVTGDQETDLRRAVACYKEALRFCPLETAPSSHAVIQTNLGFAYAELPAGERAQRMQNLHQAIACYKAALEVYTPETAMAYYAKLQLGLGAAYANLALEEDGAARETSVQPNDARDENLCAMMAHYEKALVFYTLDDAPLEYAQMQMDLAQAYTLLSSGKKAENLRCAIMCYEEVLQVYTWEDAPQFYAEVQVALGLIYAQLPDEIASGGDRTRYLQRATACYEQALRVCTLEADPEAYAQIMVYMGFAYTQLAGGERLWDIEHALVFYQEALRSLASNAPPSFHAGVHAYLGDVYTHLATLDAELYLLRAIACYETSLQVYTPETTSLVYAHLQDKLGMLYVQLQSQNWETNLRKAIACFKQALRFWYADGETFNMLTTRENLESTYEALACLYASKGDGSRVRELYQEVNALGADDTQRSRFWFSIGETYFRLGRMSEATQAYRKATELSANEFALPEVDSVSMMA